MHSTVVPVELAAIAGGTLEIGERTFLNYGISISAHQSVRIGQQCLLGTYVNIMDNHWHDILDRRATPPSQPVVIEDNVWLGNRVIVLPGVTIGHDTVVGAGAVVTKSLPPRCVAAGNPARVIRYF
jgi:maltose O-acetyltransferase